MVAYYIRYVFLNKRDTEIIDPFLQEWSDGLEKALSVHRPVECERHREDSDNAIVHYSQTKYTQIYHQICDQISRNTNGHFLILNNSKWFYCLDINIIETFFLEIV